MGRTSGVRGGSGFRLTFARVFGALPIMKAEPGSVVWHDRFKTNVLAQAATADWSGGAMEYWNNAAEECLLNTPTLTPFLTAHPANTVALGSLLDIIGADDGIDLSSRQPDISGTDRTGGQVEIGFNKLTSDGVNIYSKRDGDADFVFLARDTQTPYLDNRPLLVPANPEIREYKAMFVVGDEEIGIFSHELVVNCAP
jgi:hypothetical protein